MSFCNTMVFFKTKAKVDDESYSALYNQRHANISYDVGSFCNHVLGQGQDEFYII